MLTRDFLNKLFWLVVAGIVVSVALLVGSLGGFGPETQKVIASAYTTIVNFLNGNDKEIGRLGILVGALGTVFSGSYAIYKVLYFAEKRMPQRIEEFLEHNERHLLDAGPMLLRAIESPGAQKPWRAPIAFVGPLNDAMRRIAAGDTSAAIPDLAESIKLLTIKRDTWKSYESQTRFQLVNAHILRGVSLAAEAGLLHCDPTRIDPTISTAEKRFDVARVKDSEARNHFTKAIDLDPENPEPYYYRGLQLLRLNHGAPARLDFESAVEHSMDDEKSFVGARANYCLARILIKEQTSPGKASEHLRRATEQMPDELAHSEEGGEIFLLRAEHGLRLSRPTLNVSTQCFKRAYDAVAGIRTSRARAIQERIEAGLRQMNEIARQTAGTDG